LTVISEKIYVLKSIISVKPKLKIF
jgi:hypothetical protein